MRQLKGKVKETRKQKKERKLENAQMQSKIGTVVLPALGAIAMMVSSYEKCFSLINKICILILDSGICLPEDETCSSGLEGGGKR